MERVLQACPKPPPVIEPHTFTITLESKQHEDDLSHKRPDETESVKETKSKTKAPGIESLNKTRKGPKWLRRLFRSPEGRATAIQDL
eukprot:scaffold35225_cov183-Amphora_coffeaeformis.AAC.2